MQFTFAQTMLSFSVIGQSVHMGVGTVWLEEVQAELEELTAAPATKAAALIVPDIRPGKNARRCGPCGGQDR